jgi:hypothetical protein
MEEDSFGVRDIMDPDARVRHRTLAAGARSSWCLEFSCEECDTTLSSLLQFRLGPGEAKEREK